MFNNTKELLECLRNTDDTYKRIKELEEKIASKNYRVTASYDSTGGSGCGGKRVSQIEIYVETMMELKAELELCKARLRVVQIVRDGGFLNKEETELLEWVQLGGRLSDYAKNKGLYQSTVYKLRDKALKKVLDYVENYKTE